MREGFPNFERGGEESREIEISEGEFLKLLSGDEFLKAIGAAGAETKKSGYETGFNVYFFEDEGPKIGHIIRGGEDYVNPEFSESVTGESGFTAEYDVVEQGVDSPGQDWPKIDFHFHPNREKDPLCPSADDLSFLVKQRGRRQASLSGICMNQKNNSIDVLLIKLKKQTEIFELEEQIDAFSEDLQRKYGTDLSDSHYERNAEVDEDVQSALGNNGFENCIISYRYDKKKKQYSLSQKDEEKIKKFGGFKLKLEE